MAVTQLLLNDREYTERSSKEAWLLEEVSKEEPPTVSNELLDPSTSLVPLELKHHTLWSSLSSSLARAPGARYVCTYNIGYRSASMYIGEIHT